MVKDARFSGYHYVMCHLYIDSRTVTMIRLYAKMLNIDLQLMNSRRTIKLKRMIETIFWKISLAQGIKTGKSCCRKCWKMFLWKKKTNCLISILDSSSKIKKATFTRHIQRVSHCWHTSCEMFLFKLRSPFPGGSTCRLMDQHLM